MVVMTSNLGAEVLVSADSGYGPENAGGDAISAKTKKTVMEIVQSSYAPEFLNRIDEFIIFKRLSQSALRDIVDIRLRELQSKVDDRRITLKVGEDVKDWLAVRGYSPSYGARPLNRLIAKEIGNNLADKIIRGQLKPGQTALITLKPGGDGLLVEPQASQESSE
jgi:ATP-dependent Clp protease ATP-binding subunit ClpB